MLNIRDAAVQRQRLLQIRNHYESAEALFHNHMSVIIYLSFLNCHLLIQKRNSLTGCPVICRRDADTRGGVAGVDNLAAADVDGHMVNVIAAGIEQQISRLGITDWYGLSSGSLVPGASSRTDAEMGKYALGKSGTVSSACQACPAVHIGIAQELFCVCHHCVTGSRGHLCGGSAR